MRDENRQKGSFISSTSERAAPVIGNVLGAVLGGVVGGIPGAISGAIAGSAIEITLTKIGEEISKRQLSKSEARRIGTVYSLASKIITTKIEAGKTLRNDDFFTNEFNGRTTAEEVLEATLLSAQRDAEEMKAEYYARLFSNIAFDTSISRAMANHLVKISHQLTFRQIIILSVIGRNQKHSLISTFKQTPYSNVFGLVNVTLASEILDLYRKSLLSSSNAILDSAGINPANLSVTGYGALLFNLMELMRIDGDEYVESLSADVLSFLTGK